MLSAAFPFCISLPQSAYRVGCRPLPLSPPVRVAGRGSLQFPFVLPRSQCGLSPCTAMPPTRSWSSLEVLFLSLTGWQELKTHSTEEFETCAPSSSRLPFACLLGRWECKGDQNPVLFFFWTSERMIFISESPLHYTPAPKGVTFWSRSVMQNLSPQFSWPTGAGSSLGWETCTLSILTSRQN